MAPGLSEQPLGANWPDDDRMAPYSFVGDGRPTGRRGRGRDRRAIRRRRAGVSVGDPVVVVGKAGPEEFEVVGRGDDRAGRAAGGVIARAVQHRRGPAAVRHARQRQPRRDPRGGRCRRRLPSQQQVQALLPPGRDVVDGATGAQHRQESLTRSFTLIRVLIMGFAALALVVGMVTVANSLTLLYAERRRTLAGLRLIGAHRRQLLTAALVEAAGLAAVASLLGAPLGLLLGRVIEGAVGALGTSIPVGGSVVSLPALCLGRDDRVGRHGVRRRRSRCEGMSGLADRGRRRHRRRPRAVRGAERVANAALAAVAGIALLAG